MESLKLTMAAQDYDHMRDLTSGEIKAQGIDIIPLFYRPHDAFYRFMTYSEWEISEMSMGGYCASVADGTNKGIGIPVFPSRVFRQSAIFVRDDGSIKKPEDLAGKRVGVPEWGMTAVIYIRGWLTHQIGIPLSDIDWVQAGMNQPGRTEKIDLGNLPDGVTLTQIADKSCNEMLLSGELDAIFTAAPPAGFKSGKLRRLFPDFQPVESDYFDATGIFPIMHCMVIRNDTYERHPWVATSLMKGFEEARDRSVARMMNHGTQVPMPWTFLAVEEYKRRMFPDSEYWPYGIEPNRTTLDAFLQYCDEQGVTSRKLSVEEIFAPEVQTDARE
ncbi:MAG: 4,5-dihydroxyphthalate decarboxylase [Alphaproteobacteria bacterium]|jgi:4,5-dihydroxyphthalate decarboxylase